MAQDPQQVQCWLQNFYIIIFIMSLAIIDFDDIFHDQMILFKMANNISWNGVLSCWSHMTQDDLVWSCLKSTRWLTLWGLVMHICTRALGHHWFRKLPGPVLTLNVQGLSYLGLTRSISWLQMPWLLMSPGHQQPWYWLCRISRFMSYLRKDFNYLRRINVEKWHKI